MAAAYGVLLLGRPLEGSSMVTELAWQLGEMHGCTPRIRWYGGGMKLRCAFGKANEPCELQKADSSSCQWRAVRGRLRLGCYMLVMEDPASDGKLMLIMPIFSWRYFLLPLLLLLCSTLYIDSSMCKAQARRHAVDPAMQGTIVVAFPGNPRPQRCNNFLHPHRPHFHK